MTPAVTPRRRSITTIPNLPKRKNKGGFLAGC